MRRAPVRVVHGERLAVDLHEPLQELPVLLHEVDLGLARRLGHLALLVHPPQLRLKREAEFAAQLRDRVGERLDEHGRGPHELHAVHHERVAHAAEVVEAQLLVLARVGDFQRRTHLSADVGERRRWVSSMSRVRVSSLVLLRCAGAGGEENELELASSAGHQTTSSRRTSSGTAEASAFVRIRATPSASPTALAIRPSRKVSPLSCSAAHPPRRTAAFSAAVMPSYSLMSSYSHEARRAVAQTPHADELAAHDGRAEPLARCDGQRHHPNWVC